MSGVFQKPSSLLPEIIKETKTKLDLSSDYELAKQVHLLPKQIQRLQLGRSERNGALPDPKFETLATLFLVCHKLGYSIADLYLAAHPQWEIISLLAKNGKTIDEINDILYEHGYPLLGTDNR